jgi:hypothetical protein
MCCNTVKVNWLFYDSIMKSNYIKDTIHYCVDLYILIVVCLIKRVRMVGYMICYQDIIYLIDLYK